MATINTTALVTSAVAAPGAIEPSNMTIVRAGKASLVSYERFMYLGSKSDRMREACARYARQMQAKNYGPFLRDCVAVLLPKSQQELCLAFIGDSSPSRDASISAMKVMLGLIGTKLDEGKLKGEKLLFAQLLREVYRTSSASTAQTQSGQVIEMAK